MTLAQELAELLARDLHRLIQQIEATPAELLFATRPGITNSIGNLALHLEGNLREFVGRQFGGVPYQRTRDREFSEAQLPHAELLARLRSLLDLLLPLLVAAPDTRLAEASGEQRYGLDLTWREFLIHLLGHFNYHLGQIDYCRRILTGQSALPLAELRRLG